MLIGAEVSPFCALWARRVAQNVPSHVPARHVGLLLLRCLYCGADACSVRHEDDGESLAGGLVVRSARNRLVLVVGDPDASPGPHVDVAPVTICRRFARHSVSVPGIVRRGCARLAQSSKGRVPVYRWGLRPFVVWGSLNSCRYSLVHVGLVLYTRCYKSREEVVAVEVLTAIKEVLMMIVGVIGLGVIIRREIRETREHRKSIEKDRDPDE